ncbi:MAG: hypothetical protein ABI723_05060 [Bacteroidia bacterium]
MTFLLLASCNNRIKQANKDNLADAKASNNNDLAAMTYQKLDTTITVSKFNVSKYNGLNLTHGLAKKILYEHFKKKGCYNSDNLPDLGKMTEADNNKLSVAYDTIFTADFNNNKYADAVITYWLTPPYANGHCWQPHKAIIIDTDKGYIITNEEFIPDNYSIDSVNTVDNQVTIFGYDYECSTDKTLRYLRIELNNERAIKR